MNSPQAGREDRREKDETGTETAPDGGRRMLFALIGLIVLAFVILNVMSAIILPEVPGSQDAARNEFRFRGYPEYLSGISEPGDGQNLVLISNSQAFSGELPATHAYPSRLQGLLNRELPDPVRGWRVHNWSVDGTTSMEYMLMVAALRSHTPDLVVASVGYADFKGRNAAESFSHCRTDLPRLIGRPGIAGNLPPAFWRRHGKVEDVLAAVAKDRLPVVRLPEFFWSWLDQQIPGVQPLLYAPAVYHHPWELGLEPKRPSVQITRLAPQEAGREYYSFDERSRELLEEFLVALKQVKTGRLLVVACPGNEQPGTRHVDSVQRFREEIQRLTDQHQVPFLDLSTALPREDFIDSLHFNARNHSRYAERLWQAVMAQTGS